jgi:hypothetical protein
MARGEEAQVEVESHMEQEAQVEEDRLFEDDGEEEEGALQGGRQVAGGQLHVS